MKKFILFSFAALCLVATAQAQTTRPVYELQKPAATNTDQYAYLRALLGFYPPVSSSPGDTSHLGIPALGVKTAAGEFYLGLYNPTTHSFETYLRLKDTASTVVTVYRLLDSLKHVYSGSHKFTGADTMQNAVINNLVVQNATLLWQNPSIATTLAAPDNDLFLFQLHGLGDSIKGISATQLRAWLLSGSISVSGIVNTGDIDETGNINIYGSSSNGFVAYNTPGTAYSKFSYSQIVFGGLSGGYAQYLFPTTGTLTGNEGLYLPNKSGTLATTGDLSAYAPATGSTVYAALTGTNNFTNPNTFTAHITSGDSSIYANLVGMGSSIMQGNNNTLVAVDTATFLYKYANAKGYKEVQLGISGQSLQQITAGDNSLYSNIASIPDYHSGDRMFVDVIVNDAVRDTTQYVISTYTTQLTAWLNAAISTHGWPAAKITIGNFGYFNYTAQANHGSIPYRHYIYNAAASSVATSLGVDFLDTYASMAAANNLSHNLVMADSLHLTSAGYNFSEAALISHLSSDRTYVYTDKREAVYGSERVTGNVDVYRNITSQGVITAPTISSALGQFYNFQWGNSQKGSSSLSNSTLKIGEIDGYNYADITQRVRYMGYNASNTHNDFYIGGSNTLLTGPDRLIFYGPASFNGLGGTIIGNMNMLTGNLSLGGTSSTVADGNARVKLFGTTATGPNGNGILNNVTMTQTANSQTLSGAKFNTSFTAGSFTSGAFNQGEFDGPIYLASTSPTTTINGFMWYDGTDIKVQVGGSVFNISRPADAVNTATDANYTVTSALQFIKLPTITAGRSVSIPTASSYTGRVIRIWNQNSSGFNWTFAGATVKDASNTTLTTLTNNAVYVLESDGTNWVKIN